MLEIYASNFYKPFEQWTWKKVSWKKLVYLRQNTYALKLKHDLFKAWYTPAIRQAIWTSMLTNTSPLQENKNIFFYSRNGLQKYGMGYSFMEKSDLHNLTQLIHSLKAFKQPKTNLPDSYMVVPFWTESIHTPSSQTHNFYQSTKSWRKLN